MSSTDLEKRPRPIRADGGSEDEDDSERDDLGQPSKDGVKEGDTTARAPEKPTKKSPSRKRPAFSENNLVMDKGLTKIYRDFPKRCQYKGKGREAEFLRGLMFAYKEWGHQLFPALAFEDLASRTEKLGGKARVRDLMRELRDEERDRYIESTQGREAVEEARAQHAAETAQEASGDAVSGRKRGEREESSKGRYMDDEEGDSRPTKGRYNDDEAHESTGKGSTSTSTVISSEIRERMEANRRLALERLRMKKQEALAKEVRGETSPAKVGAPDFQKESNLMPPDDEIMDLLKSNHPEETKGHNLDDDNEVALAEVEAQDVRRKSKMAKIVPSGIVNTPSNVSGPEVPSPCFPASVNGSTKPSKSPITGSTALDGNVSSTSVCDAIDTTRNGFIRNVDQDGGVDKSEQIEPEKAQGNHDSDEEVDSHRMSPSHLSEGSCDL